MTGTPSRNTDPHQKCSSITPPTTGPRAAPPIRQVSQTPMASVRCFASLNMALIRPRVVGARAAPAIPSSARAAMSMPTLVEKAARRDAIPKQAAPASRTLRRPLRSPSVPIVIRKPDSMKP